MNKNKRKSQKSVGLFKTEAHLKYLKYLHDYKIIIFNYMQLNLFGFASFQALHYVNKFFISCLGTVALTETTTIS